MTETIFIIIFCICCIWNLLRNVAADFHDGSGGLVDWIIGSVIDGLLLGLMYVIVHMLVKHW